jgi:hypothetical protein
VVVTVFTEQPIIAVISIACDPGVCCAGNYSVISTKMQNTHSFYKSQVTFA